MVDEREERYEGEEGEYHFSDDQINYDEIEAPKSTEVPAASKDSVMDKLSKITPKRRAIIAGVVFIVLIGIVYKMLSPSSKQVPNEFTQMTSNEQPKSPVVYPTTRLATTPVQKPPSTPPTQMQAPAANNISPLGAPANINSLTVTTEQPMPVMPTMSSATPQQQIITSTVSVPSANVAIIPSPQQKNADDRLASLEQQSSAVMNLLQTEYAQKMSDYEMQGNLVRGKMDEMGKRINRIEASLNQITQLLQQGLGKSQGGIETIEGPSGPLSRQAVGPKVTYNVQAIIPGRAWLKSESGDTVTVAEGDILKDYGRITKIDPYDGVVVIDTGNKTITLSYGMSVE